MKETFGQRFQRLRKQANLTQEEVASKLNITAQAVSKWENDASAPDIFMLGDISKIFNVTVDELLGNEKVKTEYLMPEDVDINNKVLRIVMDNAEGDKIKLNLPVGLILACLSKGTKVPSMNIAGMEEIDFNSIIELIKNGVIGELADIESNDGEHIRIFVE